MATSSHRNAFELKSKNNKELFSLFDVVVVGDDPEVQRSKPFPDIFLVAASRLCSLFKIDHFDPETFLVFEDAPSGYEFDKIFFGFYTFFITIDEFRFNF